MVIRAVNVRRPRLTGWLAHNTSRLVRPRGLGPRATAVGLSVIGLLTVANAIAGLFVVTYLTLTDNPPGEGQWREVIVGNVTFYVVALSAFTVAATFRGKKLFAKAWRWLDEDRDPEPAERKALLDQPLRIGLFPLRYWTVSAVIAALSGLTFDAEPGRMLVVLVAVLEGGIVASAIGYFLAERALRDVRAEALDGTPPERAAGMSIGARLVMSWALGAGIPLVGIVVTPLVVDDSEFPVTWSMAFLAGVGLVSGLALTIITAKSITHPVTQVRQALARVGAGELEANVVVDDPGELGLLQAGVNQMVRGLRERERLEDLFGRHVGVGVARHALERGPKLGGEVRSVSALFVDLTGSTELARRVPPEEVVALLNEFFAAVVRWCDREGGWVDKFAGDAVLCVFGAPDDQTDHATRALRTVRRLAIDLDTLRKRRPELDAGIGVASGEAVAAQIGTESRLEYTIIGDPVNTASRLSDAAKDRRGRALADTNSIEAVGEREAGHWQPAGTVNLKGLPRGLRVWEPSPPVEPKQRTRRGLSRSRASR